MIASPAYDSPTILVPELDLNEVARGKFDFDLAGQDARPDVFRLFVNESARSTVVRECWEDG